MANKSRGRGRYRWLPPAPGRFTIRHRQLVVIALLALGVLALPGSLFSPSGSLVARSSPAGSTQAPARYLLALGDSLAAGYQPLDGVFPPPVDPSTGYPDQGYPGGYAADLASAWHLSLTDLACPGETTVSMTASPAKAQCAQVYRTEFGASSQLAAALSFLSADKKEVSLVTIDLGANDIESCAASGSPNATCLSKGAVRTARLLPAILSKLTQALARDDPGTGLVGMNYYDPFLGLEFRPGGPKPTAAALLSLVLLEGYNRELTSIYHHDHVPVADVASAFESGRAVPLTQYGSKLLPRDVALVCRWTWMCPVSPAVYSPDIHANTAGYSVIASAFETILGHS